MTLRHAIAFLSPAPSARRARRARCGRRGFTFAEVLATLTMLAIAMPAVMGGISLATRAGAAARLRGEAGGLAESKLNELVATGQWQNGSASGDFGADWPRYHWVANVTSWTEGSSQGGMEQLEVRVSTNTGLEPDIVVTTLVYSGINGSSSSNSSTGTTTGTGTTGTGAASGSSGSGGTR